MHVNLDLHNFRVCKKKLTVDISRKISAKSDNVNKTAFHSHAAKF